MLRKMIIFMLFVSVFTLNGCAVMEQNAQLQAENRSLHKKVNTLEKENIRLRQNRPKEDQQPISHKYSSSPSKSIQSSVSHSGETMVLSQEDLSDIARERAGSELRDLNQQIKSLNTLTQTADPSSLEYAMAYYSLMRNLTAVEDSQPYFAEMIVPGLLPAPARPTEQGLRALEQYMADERRAAAELRLREQELQVQRETAAAQKAAAESTAAAAAGAAAAAAESARAAESANEAASKAQGTKVYVEQNVDVRQTVTDRWWWY